MSISNDPAMLILLSVTMLSVGFAAGLAWTLGYNQRRQLRWDERDLLQYYNELPAGNERHILREVVADYRFLDPQRRKTFNAMIKDAGDARDADLNLRRVQQRQASLRRHPRRDRVRRVGPGA